jgi:hypothetical protein
MQHSGRLIIQSCIFPVEEWLGSEQSEFFKKILWADVSLMPVELHGCHAADRQFLARVHACSVDADSVRQLALGGFGNGTDNMAI